MAPFCWPTRSLRARISATFPRKGNLMSFPGFTAEVSLYQKTVGHTFSAAYDQQSGVRPAFWPLDPPEISVSWQPGNPGILTIAGDSFAPDSEVLLTIDNCDAWPERTTVHTTSGGDPNQPCPDPRFCGLFVGGTFVESIPCYCGGSATVTARGQYGEIAQSSTAIDC